MYLEAELLWAWVQGIEVFAADQGLRQDLTQQGFL
jgi:hypothetical protein